MPLPSLTTLPRLDSSSLHDFLLPVPGGGGPVIVAPGGPGSSPIPTSGSPSPSSGSSGVVSSITSTLFGLSLLRMAFFLLGLICIIGAIYLYRDTRFIVQGAIDTGKRVGDRLTESAA